MRFMQMKQNDDESEEKRWNKERDVEREREIEGIIVWRRLRDDGVS